MFTTNIHEKKDILIEEGDLLPLTIPDMFHSTVSRNSYNNCIAWKTSGDSISYSNSPKPL